MSREQIRVITGENRLMTGGVSRTKGVLYPFGEAAVYPVCTPRAEVQEVLAF
jgi:hypothetical protein